MRLSRKIANICEIAIICEIVMDSPYDSDVSEDTRDLISRGLASDTRRYSVVTEIGSSERDPTPARNMNVSHIRLPLTHIVQAEEPSTRGLNMAYGDNVKGQNYNIGTSQVWFEGVAEPREIEERQSRNMSCANSPTRK